jgi:hypothetical protein
LYILYKMQVNKWKLWGFYNVSMMLNWFSNYSLMLPGGNIYSMFEQASKWRLAFQNIVATPAIRYGYDEDEAVVFFPFSSKVGK